jgi:hypothetical membrane protein
MKTKNGIIILTTAYTLGILVMFILPKFSVPEYSIISNTLSEIGAQFSPNAWIMNLIFVSLAFGSVIAGWRYFEGFIAHRIVLLLFGISLILLSFFNHAPINPDAHYNLTEDGWHAYFVCSTGLSFIMLSLATSFILEKQRDRLLALAAGISVMFLSVLMAEADRLEGVWQRLIFIIAFGWLIYNFRSGEL